MVAVDVGSVEEIYAFIETDTQSIERVARFFGQNDAHADQAALLQYHRGRVPGHSGCHRVRDVRGVDAKRRRALRK